LKYKITEKSKEPYIKEFNSEEEFEDWLDENYEVVESFEQLT
jgi:hypothetical protein